MQRPCFSCNSAAAATLEYPLVSLPESRKSGVGETDVSSAALLATCVFLASFMFAFLAVATGDLGENTFCHFVLKVPHVFWMLSLETQSGHPLRLSREDSAWDFEPVRSGFESQFCGFSRVLSLSSASSRVKIKYEEVEELHAGQGTWGCK